MEEPVLVAQSATHADELIAELIRECAEGKSDREAEARAFAQQWGRDGTAVERDFAEARRVRPRLDEVRCEELGASGREIARAPEGKPAPTPAAKAAPQEAPPIVPKAAPIHKALLARFALKGAEAKPQAKLEEEVPKVAREAALEAYKGLPLAEQQ